jgi:riboflavin transporter FmnP
MVGIIFGAILMVMSYLSLGPFYEPEIYYHSTLDKIFSVIAFVGYWYLSFWCLLCILVSVVRFGINKLHHKNVG